MLTKKMSPLVVALVATVTASSAWALPAATGSSSASGNYTYTLGGKSGSGVGSDSDATGAESSVSGSSKGFGFEASGEAVGGALKAYAATSFAPGAAIGSASNAVGTASFTDYVTFTGGSGSADGLFLSTLEGSLKGGAKGSATYEYNISLFDVAAGTSQLLVSDSHTYGKGKLTVGNEYESDFSFTFGKTYALVATLSASAKNGGIADFKDTATLNFSLGSGVGLTSASGYSYGVPAVPEPQTYAMLLAGLGMVGAMARRRMK
ncbi:PEPxxWA-CTERM sorting domain-containing protein [Niveibacterium microcysteis]|nr:PEPxxWA-CTERM sorting domain-containing protein [Niveibacterium microcysteis]